jgi:hypothetical protein
MDTHQNDQHPKSEPSLQDMANIMDLELDAQDPVTNEYHTDQFDATADFNDGQVIDVESIDENEEFYDEFDPEKNRTKIGLPGSGFAKTAVIVGGTLAIIGGGALFFQSQLPKEQVATAPEKKDPAKDKVDTAQTAAVKAQQSESEMKAELALSKQRDSLNAPNSPQSSTANKTDDGKPTTNTPVATTPPVVTTAAKPSATDNKSNVTPIPIVNRTKTTAQTQNTSVAKVPSQVVSAAPGKFAATTTKPNAFATAKNAPTRPNLQVATAPAAQSVVAPTTRSNNAGLMAATSKKNSQASKFAPAVEAPSTRSRKSSYDAPEMIATVPTETGTMSNNSNQRLGVVKAPGVPSGEQLPAGVATNGDNAPPPVLTPGMQVASELPSVTQYMKQAVDPAPTTVAVAPTQETKKVVTTTPATVAIAPTQETKKVVTPIPVTVAAAPAPVLDQITTTPKETPARSALRTVPAPGMSTAISVASQNVPAPEQPTLVSLLAKSPAGDNNKNNSRTLIATVPTAKGFLADTEVATAPKTSSKEPTMTNNGQSSVVSSPGLLLAGSLLTGTSAKGSTMMPILWGGDGTSNAKFVLKLDEPLLASNRREALPAGTQMIVMAKPTANSMGVAEIDVVSIVVAGQEYAAPAGAFVVRDDQNGLLIGEDFYKRDEQIANRDTMTFVTGALGTVGRVMNQPTSTFSSVNSGGFGNNSTNVTTNGSPSIVGAVLEGGFKDLPSIWSQRNQQALTEIAGKPRIYQIAKGRSVRIFVNKPINF